MVHAQSHQLGIKRFLDMAEQLKSHWLPPGDYSEGLEDEREAGMKLIGEAELEFKEKPA